MRYAFLAAALLAAAHLQAQALTWNGFALLRGSTASERVPLDDDMLNTQVQLGIDWRPSTAFGAHVHLLARNDEDGSTRGRAGVVEAWLDQNLARGEHRLRLMEGAFFLPGSRENVDALWETPFTLTSSALNSWLGEELRPIGVDAAYTYRRSWTVAATIFRGNDTLGALPPVRGWMLHDRWTLLGEHVPVDDGVFTSVSAETDGRVGWSGRARWNNDHATVQLTYFDNRSDALTYGELENWATRFAIAAADYKVGEWTFVAESGWGETDIIPADVGIRFTNEISASYVLASRRLANGRASLRAEEFRVDDFTRHAFTAAYLWSPPRMKLRLGGEVVVAGDDRRLSLEARYYF